jgi:lactoylglutathione lyase
MTITDIRIVGVDVTDQDAALAFYTDILGFSVQMDGETPAGRWLVVAPPDASTAVALIADRAAAGHDTGIRFGTTDAAAAHEHLAARGVTVGELLEWDATPPMFSFDDPDANRFYVVEDWS